MKYTMGMMTVLLVIAGLCSGCDEDTKTEAVKTEAAEKADKNWEPETAETSHAHKHGANCDHNH